MAGNKDALTTFEWSQQRAIHEEGNGGTSTVSLIAAPKAAIRSLEPTESENTGPRLADCQ